MKLRSQILLTVALSVAFSIRASAQKVESSFWAVGTLVGISLLFSGIARLTFPMRLRAV